MVLRTAAGILLLATACAAAGCAATRGVAPAPAPALASVSWVDFDRGVRSTLVSRGYGDFDELRRTGRLDPSIKIIDPVEMGALLRHMEAHRFFERASPVSPDAPQLAGKTSQVISLRRGGETLTQAFQSHPGGDRERTAWDRDFIEIKKAIIALYRNTIQFTLVPAGGKG